jgi:hypothetical protein
MAVPNAPSLSANAVSSSRIDLSWTEPSGLPFPPVLSYTLQASSSSASTGFSTIYSTSYNGALSYSYTGLTKYNQYWFRVRATNTDGDGAWGTATEYTLATVPGVPTAFTATPSTSSVFLDWTAPTDTGGIGLNLATDYVVKRGTTTLGFTGSGTSFTDTGLSPVTAYSYTVAAVNSIGTGSTASVSTTTTGGFVHVWNGTNWTTLTGMPQVWNGTNWTTLDGKARVWNGTIWAYSI